MRHAFQTLFARFRVKKRLAKFKKIDFERYGVDQKYVDKIKKKHDKNKSDWTKSMQRTIK